MESKLKIVSFIVLLLSFNNCRKLKNENDLKGNWKIEDAFVNGESKSAMLDTMYISYYSFTVEEMTKNDKRPVATIIVDTVKATWENTVNGCQYNMGNSGTCYLENNEKLHFPPMSVKTYNYPGGLVMSNSSKCREDLFFPMFINENWELWGIIKWKRNDLWLETEYDGKSYEIRLKRI